MKIRHNTKIDIGNMNNLTQEQIREFLIKNEVTYIALSAIIDSFYELNIHKYSQEEENLMRYRIKKYVSFIDIINDDLEDVIVDNNLRGIDDYQKMRDTIIAVAEQIYLKRRDMLIICDTIELDNVEEDVCVIQKKDIFALTNSIVIEYRHYKQSLVKGIIVE